MERTLGLNYPNRLSRLYAKIGTIRGALFDRVLSREIKAAKIVRIPLSPTIAADAADLLRSGNAPPLARTLALGIQPPRPCLAPRSCRAPLGRVLVGAALPKGRFPTAQALLATLVDEAKQTGVVQKAIDAKGLKGVNVVTK